jgi:8-oxo-dGTP pyrophosphatase MutT (NUDIX family)
LPEPILQACAIPFRRRGDAVEFCLITSSSSKKWGFPKGIIEGDDTPEETALSEALEEAGLRGRIVGGPVGEYRYQKWGTDLDVTVYLMEVTKVDDDWQEAGIRERAWLSPAQAVDKISNDVVRALFQQARGILAVASGANSD